MAEFDPAAESTADYAVEAAKEGVVILDISGKACLCGCQEETPGRFRPGHDAKLKGKLLRAHLAGVKVRALYDEGEKEMTARAFAKEVSTDKHDWSVALDRRKEKERAAAEALRIKASEAAAKVGEPKQEGEREPAGSRP